jgi:hypothetical protein
MVLKDCLDSRSYCNIYRATPSIRILVYYAICMYLYYVYLPPSSKNIDQNVDRCVDRRECVVDRLVHGIV